MNRVLLSALADDHAAPLVSLRAARHRAALVEAVAYSHPRNDLPLRCALLDGRPATVAVLRRSVHGPALVAEDIILRHGGTIAEPLRQPRMTYPVHGRVLDVAASYQADAALREALRPTIEEQPPLVPLLREDLAALRSNPGTALVAYGSLDTHLRASAAHLWLLHHHDPDRDVVHALCRPPDTAAATLGRTVAPAAALLDADLGLVPIGDPLPMQALTRLHEFSDSNLLAWLRALAREPAGQPVG